MDCRKIKFDKMFTAFCSKRGTDKASTKFLFDGARLIGTQTPADLDMEDDDVSPGPRNTELVGWGSPGAH